MKRFFFLIALLTFCALIGQGLHYLKDGFNFRRIQPLTILCEDPSEEASTILSQTFHYIGRGRQCFAFASEDGCYVLKLPRTEIFKTPLWTRALPFHSYREALETRHRQRQQFVFDSFRISLEKLPDQTGVLALHLGKSPSKKSLIIIDPLGMKHHLTLGQTAFILQRKQPLLTKIFLSALKKGNREEAEKILDAWVKVIVERSRRGVENKDPSFLRNYGFDGEKAYQIDIGTFSETEERLFAKSATDSMRPIQEWLGKIDPEMLHYFNAQLEDQLR